MALLQISEPGELNTAIDTRHKVAVGIDLGTTNSLVASSRHGEVTVIPMEGGSVLLPSVVHYAADACTVGTEAVRTASQDPENTIASVKRLMGRGAKDIAYQLSYQLVGSDAGGMPLIHTRRGDISPVQVSAEILKQLMDKASTALGENPEGAVITVPAYFDEAQRQATKDAARIAGIDVLRLLSEPTAAAVAYGLDTRLEGTVIIFDLGGGTFDVSLMRLEQGVFKVLATGGDTALGGDDFDRMIVKWIVKHTLGEERIDDLIDSVDLVELHRLAKQAKHRLTEQESVEITFRDWSGLLDRQQFAELVQPLLQKSIRACRRVLRDAGLGVEDITDVVMVGGSTRSPVVREAVQQFFDRELLTSIDPDQVVAIGAAKQADVLVGNKYGDEMLLLDVIPLSLGIETMGGLMEKIIGRNTPIPVARAQEFTTFKDGQTIMNFHVLQGERELVTDCRSLARFELRGIPPMVAGAARVEVRFQVDADGLMEVSASELSTGIKSSIEIKPAFGLEENQVEAMIMDSFSKAEEDKMLRQLKEAQVEAHAIAESLEVALQNDGRELLSETEYTVLEQGVGELRQVASGSNATVIDKLSQQLNQLSEEFAARRMDREIGKVMKGKSLDELNREIQEQNEEE